MALITVFFHTFLCSTSCLYFHMFHQCGISLSLCSPTSTLYLFQSMLTAAVSPWWPASQQVCGRWGSVRHRRQNSSAVRTKTRLWAPSHPSRSPPRASAAPVLSAGRATATCATVTRLDQPCFTPSVQLVRLFFIVTPLSCISLSTHRDLRSTFSALLQYIFRQ